jgi:hypothetical protein
MRIDAINGFGKQASGAGFTRTSRPRKEIGMRQVATFQGILECTNYRFLTNQIIKCL